MAPWKQDRLGRAMRGASGAMVGLAIIAQTACARVERSTLVQVEIRIGKRLADKTVRKTGRYRAPRLEAYVSALGRRLAARSRRPHLPWSFQILDSDWETASVSPGGHVFVTRGLLAYLQSEAELAALLCHEIGHVEARHHLRYLDEYWSFVKQVVRKKGWVFSARAHWYWLLSTLHAYGPHQHQVEADALAIPCLTRSGYPARAIYHLLRLMQRIGMREYTARFPAKRKAPRRRARTSWFQRAWEARLKHVRERLGERTDLLRPLPPDRTFLRRLAGLLVAPDPGAGVVVGRQYLHPRAGFRLRLPASWAARATRNRLLAFAPDHTGYLLVYKARTDSTSKAIHAFLAGAGSAKPTTFQHRGFRGHRGEFALPRHRRADVTAFAARGGVYVVALYGQQGQWSKLAPLHARLMASLGPVEGAVPARARPWRLVLHRVGAPTTVSRWTACAPGSSAADAVRKINRLSPNATLRTGRWIKCLERGARRRR